MYLPQTPSCINYECGRTIFHQLVYRKLTAPIYKRTSSTVCHKNLQNSLNNRLSDIKHRIITYLFHKLIFRFRLNFVKGKTIRSKKNMRYLQKSTIQQNIFAIFSNFYFKAINKTPS